VKKQQRVLVECRLAGHRTFAITMSQVFNHKPIVDLNTSPLLSFLPVYRAEVAVQHAAFLKKLDVPKNGDRRYNFKVWRFAPRQWWPPAQTKVPAVFMNVLLPAMVGPDPTPGCRHSW